MATKISRFCLGVMEAAWLAAICIVPIFFNLYSSRIFEPDKITILRSLALISLAALIIKLIDEGGNQWKKSITDKSVAIYLLKYPLITPVISLIIIYSISTIFSVTPSISFFGSYQRLQGTYTTFSYLIIFVSVITCLRTRQQIRRLVTTIILASLPVSFYGLLQRYQIDPIPWAGNVSVRIAANMGNSIFVAAYLIMVLPLTVGRIIEAFREILADDNQKSIRSSIKDIINATCYVFIAALEVIAIYLSGSRGPLLGFLAAIYFMMLLLSMFWKKRWLTFSIVGLAVAGAAFLAIFNMNHGPLEALKTSPAIGRFGKLLDPESNSALVRQYIWEGTVKLVGIHDPLKFPDGKSDPYNVLRPLIGYGPETMYVAYNQFYEPELGQVEKRNASPDRSHNETWDSIVITGFGGLLVYLSIFSSVFYYGLKWQGFIETRKQQISFAICLFGGGILGSIILIVLKGTEYFGVGLPFGMVIGLIVYLTVYVLFSPSHYYNNKKNNPYALLVIPVFAAIVGHFIEINFGIAIVATRTLFWTYAGMIIVLGYILTIENQVSQAHLTELTEEGKDSAIEKLRGKRISNKNRRKVKENLPVRFNGQTDWIWSAVIGGVIIGIIIATLGFNYITTASKSQNFIEVIINSLTKLPKKDYAVSFGVLALIVTTWWIGLLLFSTEKDNNRVNKIWWQYVSVMSLTSFTIGILFWILYAANLAQMANVLPANEDELLKQVNNIASLLTKYFVYIFLIIILAGFILQGVWKSRRITRSPYIAILAIIPIGIGVIFSLLFNINVIHADISFKIAEPFTDKNQWQVVTYLYKQALRLTPKEDHYYLYLGSSYLEQAKLTTTVTDQDKLVTLAESDLKVAQSINPLNTDHTANLARLYEWWANQATTATVRADRAQEASNYFATAVTLSPNNSTLWDEWADLFLQVIGPSQQALDRLQHALELDSKYSLTLGLFGNYYIKIASLTDEASEKEQALLTAADYYKKAADAAKSTDQISKASYWVLFGNAYFALADNGANGIIRTQIKQAIDVLLQALDNGINISEQWKVQITVAKLFLKVGDNQNARNFAEIALISAPSSATSQIQDLITQTLTAP